MFGRPAGGGGLGGVALGFAQLGDRPASLARRMSSVIWAPGVRHGAAGGQQPGGAAQAVPRGDPEGNPAVGRARGAVVGVGGLAEYPAAQRGGGGVQGVGRSPGSIGGRRRVSGGDVADLLRSIRRRAGGVLPDRVSFGRGEPVPGWGPVAASGGAAWAGSGRRRASRRQTRPGYPPGRCRRVGRPRIR